VCGASMVSAHKSMRVILGSRDRATSGGRGQSASVTGERYGSLGHDEFRCGYSARIAGRAGGRNPHREAPQERGGNLGGSGRRRGLRAWRGTKGRWYRDLASGGPATLEFAGRRLAVRAIPASDPAPVARASREYLRKYQPSSHAQEMVRSEVLPTTLRLEPR
jgi:Uncharacterized protein conserved in bacteria (DUF2255)